MRFPLICYTSTSFCVLGVIGCTALAPESRFEDVDALPAERWAASKMSKSGVDHNWVKRFGDRELTRLVQLGVDSAPSMRVARERVAQSRQDVNIAGASLKPSADISMGVRRNKVNFIGGSFDGSTVTNNNNSSFDVSWEPDIWGSKRAAKSAVIGEFQAQQQELRAAKALLAANICKAWFSLAEAREQENLANKALTIRKESAAAIERRFKRDLQAEGGSASSLRLAQTDIATSKATLSQRSGEVEAARRQLEILLGHYPAAKLKGRSVMPAIGASAPVGLPSELLLRRPDILAAERRYAATGRRVEEGKWAAYPSFSLTASAGTSTEELRNILNSSFGVWSLGLKAFQPVLTGGQVKAEQLKRDSSERQALAQLQDTVIKAFGEVESALANEKWLVRRIKDYNDAHRLAKDAYQAASEDYARGTGDVLTMLNAQNRRIDIASQIALLRRLRAHMRVDLHLALGGGFYGAKQK